MGPVEEIILKKRNSLPRFALILTIKLEIWLKDTKCSLATGTLWVYLEPGRANKKQNLPLTVI